jgi:excinuclease ABC subunit B
MKRALSETERRRKIQAKYNSDNNITPEGIIKALDEGLRNAIPKEAQKDKYDLKKIPKDDLKRLLYELTSQMELAAKDLRFEEAAELRDVIEDVKKRM